MELREGTTISKEEIHQLDRLLGAALLNKGIHQQLFDEQYTDLFAEFEISKQSQAALRSVQATSLAELAQAVSPSWNNGRRQTPALAMLESALANEVIEDYEVELSTSLSTYLQPSTQTVPGMGGAD